MVDLVECWPSAVGAEIARFAWPARIGRDGTLHVNAADSLWAFELAQRGAEIARRVGVVRVRFAPGPLPERGAVPAPERAEPLPTEIETAATIAAAIGDSDLRETVQKAVSFSLAAIRSGRRF
jgi:hypothetical protein